MSIEPHASRFVPDFGVKTVLKGIAEFLFGSACPIKLVCGSLDQGIERPAELEKVVEYRFGNSSAEGIRQKLAS